MVLSLKNSRSSDRDQPSSAFSYQGELHTWKHRERSLSGGKRGVIPVQLILTPQNHQLGSQIWPQATQSRISRHGVQESAFSAGVPGDALRGGSQSFRLLLLGLSSDRAVGKLKVTGSRREGRDLWN